MRRRSTPRRDSAVVGFASLATQTASLLVFALLARLLPKGELGAYRQILVIQSVCTVLASLGVPTAMLHHVGRSTSDAETTSSYSATALSFIISTFLCAALTAGATFVAGRWLGNDVLAKNSIAAGLAGGVMLHALFIGPFLISRAAVGTYVIFASAQAIVAFALTWMWVSAHATAHAAVDAMIAAGFIGWSLTLYLLLAAGASRSARVVSQVLPTVRYGLPIAVSSALYGLAYQVDHFIALSSFSAETYALYAVGAWQVPVGPLVQRAQADVLLPGLSSHHAKGAKADFWREWLAVVTPWAVLGTALFWLVFPLADDVVRVLAGEGFAASAGVLRVYAVILPLRMAAVTAPLRSAGITWLDLVASSVFALVSFAIGWIVTPHLGLIGPATGMVAGYIAWLCVNIYGTTRYLHIPWWTVLPVQPIGAALAITGSVALLAWTFARLIVHDSALLRAVLYATTYGTLVLALFMRRRIAARSATSAG